MEDLKDTVLETPEIIPHLRIKQITNNNYSKVHSLTKIGLMSDRVADLPNHTAILK